MLPFANVAALALRLLEEVAHAPAGNCPIVGSGEGREASVRAGAYIART
jgi:hypothetical protein